ncbi:MAG: hypothetical protein IJ496_06585 [Ruminococcus sp.]|nr:hypothetical protein [Ruminococcus sp.]
MKMKKIAAGVMAMASVAVCSAGATVYADEIPTKDEVIEYIWEDFWRGQEDDGTEFPQASWRYNVVVDWVEANYEDLSWSSDKSYWEHKFEDDYENMISGWDFNDDREGRWTIITDEGETYSFEFIDGQWNQFDSNGNVVDMFTAHSTLGERDEQQYVPENEKEAAVTAVKNTTAANAQTAVRASADGDGEDAAATTAMAEDAAQNVSEEDKGGTSPLVYIFVGLSVIAAGLGAVYVIKTKKK